MKKNLQDSVVKQIIFTTQKIKFTINNLFNVMRICSHLIKKFLTEKVIFCALICANKVIENFFEEEKNLFFKSYVPSLFTFLEKVLAIFKFVTALCLDVRFSDLLYFICLKFNPQYCIFFFAGRKCVDLEVISEGERKNFLKSC